MCRRSASSTLPNSIPAIPIEAVIWVAVGGRGTLVGAALGAVVVNFAKTYSPASFPNIGCSVLALFSCLSRCSCQGHSWLVRKHAPDAAASAPAALVEAKTAEEGGSAQ